MDKRIISFQISDDLDRATRAEAMLANVSRSAFIRQALASRLEQIGRERLEAYEARQQTKAGDND
jgi:hypothetical protein